MEGIDQMHRVSDYTRSSAGRIPTASKLRRADHRRDRSTATDILINGLLIRLLMVLLVWPASTLSLATYNLHSNRYKSTHKSPKNNGARDRLAERQLRNNYNNGPWQRATATWYGSPSGAGSDGGACGYGVLASSPYGSNVGAVSSILFKNGRGCGACYQVRCLGGRICSSKPVTVVATDWCPGCAGTHFDLSGTAFGNMAATLAQRSPLRNLGILPVLYRRVPCSYRGIPLTFEVNQGSSNYWFSMLIKYQAGDGDLSKVELMQKGSGDWIPMQQLWGAYWCLNWGPLHAPFSIRLTTSYGLTLTSMNAIPANWYPGARYTAHGNFPDTYL